MPANACYIILFLRSSRCKGRGGSVSRRDHNQLAGKRAQLAGAHKYAGRDKLIPKPLSGREREGGKDSHSRQWRLSMAVFLNRNKRPSAAPIEVADASLREAASPGVLPPQSPLVCLHHGFRHLGRWRDSGVTDGKGGKLTYLRGNRNAGELL